MASALSSILIAAAAGLLLGGWADQAPAAMDAGLLVAALAGAQVVLRFAEAGH